MTRTEYLNRLAHQLRRLPKEDFEIAMDYFQEYFEEAGPDREQEAIQNLGSPEEAADTIIRNMAYEQLNTPSEHKSLKRHFSTLWVVILAILASPIALPLAIVGISLVLSAGAVLISLMVTAAAVALSLIVASVLIVFGGIWLTFSAPMDGLATLGLGIMGCGLSILVTAGALWLCRALFRLLARLAKKLIRKGGNRHDKN